MNIFHSIKTFQVGVQCVENIMMKVAHFSSELVLNFFLFYSRICYLHSLEGSFCRNHLSDSCYFRVVIQVAELSLEAADADAGGGSGCSCFFCCSFMLLHEEIIQSYVFTNKVEVPFNHQCCNRVAIASKSIFSFYEINFHKQ